MVSRPGAPVPSTVDTQCRCLMMEEWEDPEVMMHSYLQGNFRRKRCPSASLFRSYCDIYTYILFVQHEIEEEGPSASLSLGPFVISLCLYSMSRRTQAQRWPWGCENQTTHLRKGGGGTLSVGLQWTLCEHCDVSQVTRELETPLKEGTAGESWWGVRQNSGAVAPVEMMSPPPPHPAAASVVHSNK